jgi:hypothetical protein
MEQFFIYQRAPNATHFEANWQLPSDQGDYVGGSPSRAEGYVAQPQTRKVQRGDLSGSHLPLE